MLLLLPPLHVVVVATVTCCCCQSYMSLLLLLLLPSLYVVVVVVVVTLMVMTIKHITLGILHYFRRFEMKFILLRSSTKLENLEVGWCSVLSTVILDGVVYC